MRMYQNKSGFVIVVIDDKDLWFSPFYIVITVKNGENDKSVIVMYSW